MTSVPPDSSLPSSTAAPEELRENLWRWAAGIAGFLAPLSFNIGYFLRDDKKRNFIAGMDLVVVALLVLALVRWRSIPALLKAVPKSAWLFFAAVALTLLGTVAAGTHSLHDLNEFRMEVLKKTLGNYAEYLLLAPVLMALLLDGKNARLAALMRGLLLAGLVAAAAGCRDFWDGSVLDVEVAGLYDHRNLLGGAMAMLVPMAAAVVLFDRCKVTQALAGLVVMGGVWCQTTLGALLGILGGVLAVTALAWTMRATYRRCPFKIIGVAVLVALLPVLSNLLSPREKTSDGFTEAQAADHYRGYTLQPRSQLDAAFESIAPWKYEDPADPQSPKTRLSDRARRWQAQINLIRKNPFGCGTGFYQKDISRYYGEKYPKPGERTDLHTAWGAEADEPGSVGLYEVVATEMGMLGLLALLAFFMAAFARAGSRVLQAPKAMELPQPTAASEPAPAHGAMATAIRIPFDALAGVYAFAALSGAALFSIFHDPVASRGPAGLVAVALGLTIALAPKHGPSPVALKMEPSPAGSPENVLTPTPDAAVLSTPAPMPATPQATEESIRARQDEGAIGS